MEELGLGSTFEVSFDNSVAPMDCPVSWDPIHRAIFGTTGSKETSKTLPEPSPCRPGPQRQVQAQRLTRP